MTTTKAGSSSFTLPLSLPLPLPSALPLPLLLHDDADKKQASDDALTDKRDQSVLVLHDRTSHTFRVSSYDQSVLFGTFEDEFHTRWHSYAIDVAYSHRNRRVYLAGIYPHRPFLCYDLRTRAIVFRKTLAAQCWLYDWDGAIVALPYLDGEHKQNTPLLFDGDGCLLKFAWPKNKVWYWGAVDTTKQEFVATSVHSRIAAFTGTGSSTIEGKSRSEQCFRGGYTAWFFSRDGTTRTMDLPDSQYTHVRPCFVDGRIVFQYEHNMRCVEADGKPSCATLVLPCPRYECTANSHSIVGLAGDKTIRLPMSDTALPTPRPAGLGGCGGHTMPFHSEVRVCRAENSLLLNAHNQAVWEVSLDGNRVRPFAECSQLWYFAAPRAHFTPDGEIILNKVSDCNDNDTEMKCILAPGGPGWAMPAQPPTPTPTLQPQR